MAHPVHLLWSDRTAGARLELSVGAEASRG